MLTVQPGMLACMQARHPFLDEGLQLALLETPLPLLADLALPPGVGDKRLLRLVLRALGLPRAAARPKRAIQFGSRLGRAANVRDWGSNRAANAAGAGGVRLRDAPGAALTWPGPERLLEASRDSQMPQRHGCGQVKSVSRQ